MTTRYIASWIEAVGIDRVVTLDIHNEAAFDNAFRCHTVRLEAAEVFAAHLEGELCDRAVTVMSPDIGGVKRAQRLRECLVRTLAREADVVSGGTLVGDVYGRVEIIRAEPIPAAATLPEQLREAPQASRHPATI